MAQRSTFLLHVTADGGVRIEVVATGEVVSVPALGMVGSTIERWMSDRASGEDGGMEG